MSTTNHAEPTDEGCTATRLTGGRLLARNAVWNLASTCLPMAVAIGAIPPMIRGLGTDRFGLMTLSWMVLGYFSMFDLGLGRALTKMVAEKLGRGEEGDVPGLVWTALALMTALGLVGSAFVAVITPWLVVDALHIAGPLRAEALASFYLMAAALPIVIGTAGLRGVMEAHQRFGAINVVRTATSLFILLAPLLALAFTADLVVIVGIVCLGRLASWLVHVFLCLKTIPAMRAGFVFRRDLVRPLMTYGGWMTLVNVVNPLMVQMDRFLIGALVSMAAVAYYTTPYELITRTWFLSNSVLGVMFPAFATSFVLDRGRTSLIFGRCVKHVSLILFPVTLATVAFSHEVLTIWLGADFASQSAVVLQWLAFGVFLNGLAQVPSALMQGIGRPDLTLWVHLIELPFYLAAAWLLIAARGIEGAAMAWTGRTAIDVVLYFALARSVLPECRAAVLSLVRGVAAALAALAVTALPLGLAYRGWAFVIVGAAFGVIAWTRMLSSEERRHLLDRLSTLRHRLRPARSSVSVATAIDH